MAYITAEQIADRRKQINALYPAKAGWKFSITREHHSSIRVIMLIAPIQLTIDPDIQHIRIHDHGIQHNERLNDAGKEVWGNIEKIVNVGNFDKSDIMTDYFHVGFYTDFEMGRWDQDFICTAIYTAGSPAPEDHIELISPEVPEIMMAEPEKQYSVTLDETATKTSNPMTFEITYTHNETHIRIYPTDHSRKELVEAKRYLRVTYGSDIKIFKANELDLNDRYRADILRHPSLDDVPLFAINTKREFLELGRKMNFSVEQYIKAYVTPNIAIMKSNHFEAPAKHQPLTEVYEWIPVFADHLLNYPRGFDIHSLFTDLNGKVRVGKLFISGGATTKFWDPIKQTTFEATHYMPFPNAAKQNHI